MKIDIHISELLYDHDCVIVPDFGGFVANYAPAKIHPVQHTFIPPSKNIVFNKNLKNNDGLLANHIAVNENANYSEALKYIDHFVESVNADLKKGTKVKIEDVGTLFLDVERNIQFEPNASVNHLTEAFGLSEFQSPAIKRDTPIKRIEKELVNRGPIPAEKKKINVKRVVALTLMVPVIAALIWIPLKTDLLKNINYSSLNPFASKTIVKPVVKDIVKDTAHYKITPPIAKDTVAHSVTQELVEAVKPDTTHVVASTPDLDYKFHLVAGCFQIEDNAIKFVATLQQQSLNAAIIGKNEKGLYVVSCGDYATRREANDQLSNLRKLQPNAWLYKN